LGPAPPPCPRTNPTRRPTYPVASLKMRPADWGQGERQRSPPISHMHTFTTHCLNTLAYSWWRGQNEVALIISPRVIRTRLHSQRLPFTYVLKECGLGPASPPCPRIDPTRRRTHPVTSSEAPVRKKKRRLGARGEAETTTHQSHEHLHHPLPEHSRVLLVAWSK
jgi:hypothetical protein